MNLLRILLIMAVMSSVIINCSNNATESNSFRELSSYEKGVVESGNNFGIELFKQVAESYPDSNICISPLSAAMALGMTYNGARTTTQDAMDSVLGLTGMEIEEVNRAYQSLIDLLIGLDPSVTFEIANSIWYRNTFDISQDFVDLNSEHFYAEVDPLDFSDPLSVDIINNWVDDKTHGRIESIINPPINNDAVMFLINAIYFLADWQYQFDPQSTTVRDFYITDDATVSCQMMYQANVFDYYQAENELTLVRLPYGDDLFEMVVILPSDNISINEFIAGLDDDDFTNWITNTSSNSIDLYMPKFVMEFEDSLNDELSDMGMGIAFIPNKADFTGMKGSNQNIKDLFISMVKQKTYIKVDEDGTEAAAVTAVEIDVVSVPQRISVVLDRPFAFIVMEKKSNAILFMGKVARPDWPQ